MQAVFWRNLHKCRFFFIGQVIVLEHKGRPCKLCDSGDKSWVVLSYKSQELNPAPVIKKAKTPYNIELLS